MAMFGKTIGNGYALTAVVGKRSVMEAAQKTFISSTFWTERIGPTAALKTLEVMKRIHSWDIITENGKRMQKGWQDLANQHQLNIAIAGIPSLTTYSFQYEDALKYKTFLTQEMLKRGFLASTNFYASIAHEDKYFDMYFENLNEVYQLIRKCIDGIENVDLLLEGPVCHSGFKRLN
jgi:glutamate-1-semialdehyde aminotransferase